MNKVLKQYKRRYKINLQRLIFVICSFVVSKTALACCYEDLYPPELLVVTAVSPNKVLFSWNRLVLIVTEYMYSSYIQFGDYRIEQKKGECSSSNPWITRLDVNVPMIDDDNPPSFIHNIINADDVQLMPNTTYSYRVISFLPPGIPRMHNPGEYASNCISITTAKAGTPTAPTEIVAVSRSNTTVDLYWKDESNNETSFVIQRKSNTGDWVSVKTVAANIQNYRDTTATGNTSTNSYSYTVSACNASGCSVLNPNAFTIPFSPTNLAVNNKLLTWSDNSANESGFQVFRKNGNCSATNPWTIIAEPKPDTKAYYDSSAVSGELYSYQVRAGNYQSVALPYSYGYSNYSTCISATAP